MAAASPASSTRTESDHVDASEKQPRWRISSLSRRTGASTQQYAYESFHRGKQLRHMIFWTFCRWLFTAVLAMSIFVVIWKYSQPAALPAIKKSEFNSLVIGLSIAYSLNLASALKRDASYLRWWLLSLRPYSPREADLILQCENMSGLLKLGYMSRHLSIRLFVLLFLTLNMAAQVALALLGITYNINPADHITVTRPGLVSIPDMSSIQLDKSLISGTRRPDLDDSQTENARRYMANTFGQSTLTMQWDSIDDAPKPGKFNDARDPILFYNITDGLPVVYTYYFYESSPQDADYVASVATNRTISAWSDCKEYKVVAGGDGLSPNITFLWEDNEPISWELPSAKGPDQVMYIHDPELDAGDTWAVIYAFEASIKEPWFYRCNTTIGSVTNAVVKEHEVSANVTRYAAAAIALQGYGSSAGDLTNNTKFTQWQSYPSQSTFGYPYNGTADMRGATASLFAIGTVVAVAGANDDVEVRGMTPMRGITLEIASWTTLYLILGLTVGLQLFFSVAAVVIANTVQLRGHSHLAMAALLRESLDGLGSAAPVASGKQVAAMMGDKAKLRYERRGKGRGYHVMVS